MIKVNVLEESQIEIKLMERDEAGTKRPARDSINEVYEP